MLQSATALAAAGSPVRVAPTTSGYLKRPDAEIYYEVTGSGPAIVFAHGLGGNHLSWWQQVAYFSGRYKCVTFAHRGFAPSRLVSESPDPTLYAGDLAALVEHLKLSDFRLVAQSMGGWTCLDYTVNQADRVKAMVMADTTGTLDPGTLDKPDQERIGAWMAAHQGGEADLFARGIHPAAGDRMAREQAGLHFLYREIDQMSQVDKQALRAKLVAARKLPASALRRLRLPVLFITGEEDIVFPPPLVAAAAGIIPGAKLERVPEAGHSVYFERAGVFNRLVDRFFSGQG